MYKPFQEQIADSETSRHYRGAPPIKNPVQACMHHSDHNQGFRKGGFLNAVKKEAIYYDEQLMVDKSGTKQSEILNLNVEPNILKIADKKKLTEATFGFLQYLFSIFKRDIDQITLNLNKTPYLDESKKNIDQ
ncbi:MAG: hypothetical protein LC670_10635 [Flavobacteriales bacterium]|nr:hypothetical protein [Flavobacteriales bacterium]